MRTSFSFRDWPSGTWQGLTLVIIPALLLIAIQTYTATRAVPELRQSQRIVTHTLTVIAEARALDNAVRDAESGQRGYVITGNDGYLDPYSIGMHEAGQHLKRLQRLTADNPEQQKRLSVLQAEITAKFNELRRTVDLRRTSGFDAAKRVVESNAGFNSMRTITSLIGFAIGAETVLLRERETLLAEAQRRAALTSGFGIVLALLAIAGGAVLLARSVSREVKQAAELRESEERFRLLVSGVKDHAIFMLDPEGNIVSWNEGAQRIKGYSPDEIIGRNFSVFYPTEDIAQGAPAHELERAAADGSVEVQGWRYRKDRSKFFADAVITALRDESGSLRGFAKITRNITEKIATQKTLDQTRAALAQAQKMEAVGQLTGGLAHDFNNMLTAVIGSIDLIQRRKEELAPERLAELLVTARSGAEQGAGLVRQLLAFSRRQTLAPRAVDVNRLVGGMSELLRRTLGEAIAFETVLGGGLWQAFVDPNQIESAVLNLALNARDAMPEGGKLTIETRNTYLDEAYAAAHSEVLPGQYLVLCVSDTGGGMPPEVLERAFEPFFTTKPEGKGTGLGLSQVHGFVKQSGGHIKLYSEPGGGTTVKIYLPRHVSAVPFEQEERARPAISDTDGRTVLAVEDQPLVRMYAVEALESLGYRVLEAGTGAEALEVLGRHPETVLLFSDVGLPGGMNGRQLAEEARRRMPHLKVLFATGYARNAIVHNGVLDPGVELLEKPYTVEVLGQKLQQILASG